MVHGHQHIRNTRQANGCAVGGGRGHRARPGRSRRVHWHNLMCRRGASQGTVLHTGGSPFKFLRTQGPPLLKLKVQAPLLSSPLLRAGRRLLRRQLLGAARLISGSIAMRRCQRHDASA
jgi:hypothetical protein